MVDQNNRSSNNKTSNNKTSNNKTSINKTSINKTSINKTSAAPMISKLPLLDRSLLPVVKSQLVEWLKRPPLDPLLKTKKRKGNARRQPTAT
tara:strand:+ start:79 stop:354 length:276 start_codon:yes stop_codon:yes gene_type:complete